MSDFKRYSGILVKHRNKVLLCKRSENESLPGQWSIPSGKIEDGELPIQAAIREFKEETNIKIQDDIDLIGLINKYKNDGQTKKGLIFVYHLDSDKKIIPNLEKAQDGFEHTKCGYFSKETLPLSKKSEQLNKIIKKVLK